MSLEQGTLRALYTSQGQHSKKHFLGDKLMTQRTIAALMLALGLATLAGCASPTVITLNDGREIQAVDTPTFDKASGFYEFEQLDGKQTRINKDQVRTVKDL
jgi:hypothetical protein